MGLLGRVFGGGGQDLGTARGKIEIDTRDVTQGVRVVRRGVREMQDAWSQGSRGVRALMSDVRSLRGELTALGAGGALVTGFGLNAAKNLRNYRVSFRTLLGDQQEADRVMTGLVEQANRFGIEMNEVNQLARALLPALEGDTAQLDDFVSRAARLASTNPLKGTADAARAIQEYLAGQTISLQRLFNVDPNLIAEAEGRFEGVGDQLDYILERMGATEAAAEEMADGLVGVKNELTLLAADGFSPLFESMQENLRGFREWVADIRQNRPEVAKLGADMATAAAIGAPLLVFLGQVSATMEKIGRLGPGLGRGLAAGAGFGVGLLATREIGRRTGNEDLATITAPEAIKRIVDFFLQSFLLAVRTIGTAINTVVTVFEAGVLRIRQMVANLFQAVADAAGRSPLLNTLLGGATEGLEALGKLIAPEAEAFEQVATRAAQRQDQLNRGFIDLSESLGLLNDQVEEASQTAEAAASAPLVAGTRFTEEQVTLWQDYRDQLAQINQETTQQLLDLERNYQQQRAGIIEDFNRRLAREEEDLARSRVREDAQLADQITDIRGDARDREAEAEETHRQKLADLQEDYEDRVERMASSSQRDLLRAAANLDAKRVAQIKQDAADRRDQLREDLQERVEQEEESHRERLDAAREADRERINDLREGLRQRRRLEDEDRAVRLARQREDHNRQLAELESANQQRIAEISQQASRERALLRDNFLENLLMMDHQLGIKNRVEQQRLQESLEQLEAFYDANVGLINQKINELDPTARDRERRPWAYQSGGPVRQTGMALVHAGEYVLNPETTRTIAQMLGGGFNQQQLVGAMGGGGNTMSTVFNIQGDNAGDIANKVERVLIDLFGGLK